MKNNTNGARAWGLIVDYAMWYFIQVVMILFAFLVVYNKTPIAGDLQAYKVHFDEIMHEPVFITIFVGIVLIGEIGIPLLFGGQSISKKIFKIKVEPFSVRQTVIRGFVKILIINPNGVVAFILGCAFSSSVVNGISTVLGILLVVNAILVLKHRPTMYEMISKTHVVKAKKVGGR